MPILAGCLIGIFSTSFLPDLLPRDPNPGLFPNHDLCPQGRRGHRLLKGWYRLLPVIFFTLFQAFSKHKYCRCERFALSGCIVYATARRAESMTDLSANIKKLTLDVTNEQAIIDAVQTILSAEGRIDIVVNNAGMICIGMPMSFFPFSLYSKKCDIFRCHCGRDGRASQDDV